MIQAEREDEEELFKSIQAWKRRRMRRRKGVIKKIQAGEGMEVKMIQARCKQVQEK